MSKLKQMAASVRKEMGGDKKSMKERMIEFFGGDDADKKKEAVKKAKKKRKMRKSKRGEALSTSFTDDRYGS